MLQTATKDTMVTIPYYASFTKEAGALSLRVKRLWRSEEVNTLPGDTKVISSYSDRIGLFSFKNQTAQAYELEVSQLISTEINLLAIDYGRNADGYPYLLFHYLYK